MSGFVKSGNILEAETEEDQEGSKSFFFGLEKYNE